MELHANRVCVTLDPPPAGAPERFKLLVELAVDEGASPASEIMLLLLLVGGLLTGVTAPPAFFTLLGDMHLLAGGSSFSECLSLLAALSKAAIICFGRLRGAVGRVNRSAWPAYTDTL